MWCPWTSLALPLTRPPPGFSAHSLESTLAAGSARGVLVLCLTPASPFHGPVERTRCPERGLWSGLRLSGRPGFQTRSCRSPHERARNLSLSKGSEASPTACGKGERCCAQCSDPRGDRVWGAKAAVPPDLGPGHTAAGDVRDPFLLFRRADPCVAPGTFACAYSKWMCQPCAPARPALLR